MEVAYPRRGPVPRWEKFERVLGEGESYVERMMEVDERGGIVVICGGGDHALRYASVRSDTSLASHIYT
jgi:thioredoxin reductase